MSCLGAPLRSCGPRRQNSPAPPPAGKCVNRTRSCKRKYVEQRRRCLCLPRGRGRRRARSRHANGRAGPAACRSAALEVEQRLGQGGAVVGPLLGLAEWQWPNKQKSAATSPTTAARRRAIISLSPALKSQNNCYGG
jgi:hypothetical protein